MNEIEKAIEILKEAGVGTGLIYKYTLDTLNGVKSMAISSMEKQLSKKVATHEADGSKIYFCDCGDNVSIDDDYCSQCGQALRWEPTNE